MSVGGGEDFDLWRGRQRMRTQVEAPPPDAERMRNADYRDEKHGRLWALALVIAVLVFLQFTGD